MTSGLFENPLRREARPLVFLKRGVQILLALYLVSGLESSYRAYYQVHSLDIRSTDQMLRAGSSVETKVVSYGRTPVDVKVELIQGQASETLAVQFVSSNYFAALDPRWRQATQTIVITPGMLARFQAGPAMLRATAIGRHQWMRLPPPVVCEATVEIQN